MLLSTELTTTCLPTYLPSSYPVPIHLLLDHLVRVRGKQKTNKNFHEVLLCEGISKRKRIERSKQNQISNLEIITAETPSLVSNLGTVITPIRPHAPKQVRMTARLPTVACTSLWPTSGKAWCELADRLTNVRPEISQMLQNVYNSPLISC